PLERLRHARPMLTSAKEVPLRLGLRLRGSAGAADRVVGSTGEEEPQEGDPHLPRPRDAETSELFVAEERRNVEHLAGQLERFRARRRGRDRGLEPFLTPAA